ncbi:MAG: hypothetical protein K8T90_09400 [Planctomycetes bacterium]|nr:hypothetical protein [Planctomycetota bacterium]
MSETHIRPSRSADPSGSAMESRLMVPLWAIFAGILALQVLIVAVGFRFLA